MKLLSVQMAIFSEESISRPDLLFNEVNEKLGGLINDMPTILNLPPDIPAEIPGSHAASRKHYYTVLLDRTLSAPPFLYNLCHNHSFHQVG